MPRFAAFFLLFLASACTVPPSVHKAEDAARFLSLSPDSLGRSVSLSQLVTGEYDGRTYRMRYEIDITPERLAIVGLSPLGLTLFTLTQEGGKRPVVVQMSNQAAFDPRHVLFDLYITYWPRKTLQAALAPLSMQLDENVDGSVRRIRAMSGEPIAQILYPPRDDDEKSGIVIQHFDFPYRLRIVTLSGP